MRQGYAARNAARSDFDAALRGRNQRLAIRSKLAAYRAHYCFRNLLANGRDGATRLLNTNAVCASASIGGLLFVISSNGRNRVVLDGILRRGGRHTIDRTCRTSERPLQERVERAAPETPHGKNREQWMAQFLEQRSAAHAGRYLT